MNLHEWIWNLEWNELSSLHNRSGPLSSVLQIDLPRGKQRLGPKWHQEGGVLQWLQRTGQCHRPSHRDAAKWRLPIINNFWADIPQESRLVRSYKNFYTITQLDLTWWCITSRKSSHESILGSPHTCRQSLYATGKKMSTNTKYFNYHKFTWKSMIPEIKNINFWANELRFMQICLITPSSLDVESPKVKPKRRSPLEEMLR